LQTTIPSFLGTSVIGFVGGEERIRSNSLGDHSRYNIGFIGEHQLILKERVQLAPGILVYYYSKWGWQAFPGVDIGITLFENLKFYGTFGRSFRVPSFTEYYMSHTTADIYGDPSLKPSEAISFESGLKYLSKLWSGSISWYYRQGKNIIDWLIDTTTGMQSVESRNINTNGLEVEMNIFPKQLIEKTPISKFSLQYTYINSDFDKIPGFTSKYLGNPLQHQFGTKLAYNYFEWFDHYWKMKYEKRLNQEGYFLLDTRVNFRFWESVLFFEITNIFNTKYFDIEYPNGVTIPMPGRWFKGGLNITLSKQD
jgi:iron complex outermembrane receptor protein